MGLPCNVGPPMKFSIRDLLLKRRWYQFSIRLLLVATFALSLPLARIAYLQRMVAFHEAEQRRIISELAKVDGYNRLAKSESPEAIAVFLGEELRQLAEGTETVKVIGGWPGTSLFAGRAFIPVDDEREVELWVAAIHERQLIESYKRVVFRPWKRVNEPPSLKVEYGQRKTP
jgi:hypothetical protein